MVVGLHTKVAIKHTLMPPVKVEGIYRNAEVESELKLKLKLK